MGYVNVGCYVNGRNAASKAAIRKAIAAGERVTFYNTSLFDGDGRYTVIDGRIDNLHPSTTLSVVGPDPYSDRRFYGAVTVGKDGKVRVA